MNYKCNILSGAVLLLLAGGCFQSCQKDDFEGIIPDRETLITRGQYLTARSADAFALDYSKDSRPFPVGTPYRLLAFSKASSSVDERATHSRFNKVAWEGELTDIMRYINIESNPDKWFGFSALEDETDFADADGLVSLDFYGFTYGAAEDHTPDYIELDGITGETTPVVRTLADLNGLTRTETVSETGMLTDLMHGELFNQNISTAGVDGTTADGTQIPTPNTQSVIPFKHCFSKVRIQISQQGDEDNKDADGNPTPRFDNLYVEDIVLTGTYGKGVVSLADGKINVSEPMNRALKFKDGYDGKVTVNDADVGEMLILPSDGECLSNADMGDGYDVGLQITVKSTVKKDIENMLHNTGSPEKTTEETDANGVKWYKGTIKKEKIIDFYDVGSTTTSLHFKQNTSYLLIITFKKDAVRIITVIPMIEEWLPGEGTPNDPWQYQALGQPQMFDNIVWNDRNFGANHFDPTGANYEGSVGYFYQAGRNIPYFPFKYKKNGATISPSEVDLKNITKQDLINSSSAYGKSEYRFLPIVDKKLLTMTGSMDWCMDKRHTPQMNIPEEKPTTSYFDFFRGGNTNYLPGDGLSDEQNMHWENGQPSQPVGDAWVIPSSKDFLSIFPSTPHAGNITFREGWWNSTPMGWGPGEMGANHKVLRVTVPYYKKGNTSPSKSNASENYIKAWNTLKDNNDVGTTTEGYNIGPGSGGNPDYEPDGDPEDGYASVYILSRDGKDLVEPEILKHNNSHGQSWAIKSWGTIYAIKRIYTERAYRIRWRVLSADITATNPCFYIEICRYRCDQNAKLTVDNFKTYDWEHPASTLYIPICGLGDWTGEYINFGTECQYATSNKISGGKTDAVQIKITGNDAWNSYISVVRGVMNRNFGMQIRPIRSWGGVNLSK